MSFGFHKSVVAALCSKLEFLAHQSTYLGIVRLLVHFIQMNFSLFSPWILSVVHCQS